MTEIPNKLYRTSVKALILDDKKRFLLLLEENGYWDLPGGGLDFGENSHDCIIRELNEETGLEVIHIKKNPSYFITALHMNGQWKANILYETQVKDLNFTSSKECVEIRFFTKEEASKEKIYPNVKEFLKEYNPNNH
ncbi:MAG: NUDIX hydrolase [Patescibacteria group bacterium]